MRFTVFTASYNRASTIHRVFESLQAQTYTDFEWLIVDDGSVDNTAEVVQQFTQQASFKVRYLFQPNGGKHRALNRGISEAVGELFLNFDSDDSCPPNSLERFAWHWDQIPKESRARYVGVTALCSDRIGGAIIGDRFPSSPLDSNPFALRTAARVRGDKWGFQSTAVLRKFPFPEFDGEKFLSEGVVWNRIGQYYLTRYVNEVLQHKEYRPDGLSATLLHQRTQSPRGACLYYEELARLPVSIGTKLKAHANALRFAFHAQSLRSNLVLSQLPFRAAVLPVALGLYAADWLENALKARIRP